MESIKNIRLLKKELREKVKSERLALTKEYKTAADRKIRNKFFNLWILKEFDTVLCYVSTDIEVDTRDIIKRLWDSGKRVAVPRCENLEGDMSFFYINSFDDLETGSFCIPEPKKDCELFTDCKPTLCIVPAFLFDENGYRLGYGKGYYDRFLSKYKGTAIGICYDINIKKNLYHGKYDRNVSLVVTDKRIINI